MSREGRKVGLVEQLMSPGRIAGSSRYQRPSQKYYVVSPAGSADEVDSDQTEDEDEETENEEEGDDDDDEDAEVEAPTSQRRICDVTPTQRPRPPSASTQNFQPQQFSQSGQQGTCNPQRMLLPSSQYGYHIPPNFLRNPQFSKQSWQSAQGFPSSSVHHLPNPSTTDNRTHQPSSRPNPPSDTSRHPASTRSQAPGAGGESYQPTAASFGTRAAAAPPSHPQYGTRSQSTSGSRPIPQNPNAPRVSTQRAQSTQVPSARASSGAQSTGQGSGQPYSQANQPPPQRDFQQSPGSARPWPQTTPPAPPPQSTSYGNQHQAPNNPFSARTWTPQAQAASQTAPQPPTSSTRNGHQAPTPSETRYPAPDSPFVTPETLRASASPPIAPSMGTRSSATESVYPMGKPKNMSDLVSWHKIAQDRFETYSRRIRLSKATHRYGEALQSEGWTRDRNSNRHRFSKSARQGLNLAGAQDEFCNQNLMALADEDLDEGQFAYMMSRCMSDRRFNSHGVRLPSEGACEAIGTLAAYSTAPDSAMIEGAMQTIEGRPAPVDEIDWVIDP